MRLLHLKDSWGVGFIASCAVLNDQSESIKLRRACRAECRKLPE